MIPLLVVLLVLLSLGAGWFILSTVADRIVESEGAHLSLLAVDFAEQMDSLLFERQGDLQVAAILLRANQNPRTLTPYLTTLKEQYGVYQWLAIADAAGTVMAATDPATVGHYVGATPWFQAVQRSGRMQGYADTQPSEGSRGRPGITLAAARKSENGSFAGAVIARVGFDELETSFSRTVDTYAQRRGKTEPLEWQVLASDGRVLIDSLQGPEDRATNLRQLGLPSAALSQTGNAGYIEEAHVRRGVPVITGYAKTLGHLTFPGFGWSVLVRIDRDAVLAPIHQAVRTIGLLVMGIVLPTAGTMAWLTIRLRREWRHGQEELARVHAAEAVVRAQSNTFQSLVEAIRQLTSHQDLSPLLQSFLDMARSLTGARYAALGVLDETGETLEQFLTSGLDETARQAIGSMPQGRGLLGHLMKDESPIRVTNIGQHPASVGFPSGHPAMQTFLGISIRAQDRLFGRLYLTDKHDQHGAVVEFTELDEQIVQAFALQAGAAIHQALLLRKVSTAKAKLRLILESSGEGIYGLDMEGHCTFINKAGATQLGFQPDELIGRLMHEAIHAQDRDDSSHPVEECALYKPLRSGDTNPRHETVVRIKDGALLPVECAAFPIYENQQIVGTVVIFQDITARRNAEQALCNSEEKLRQAQKMEAVGRLAGGIAHDFNNLLTVINGYSELLLLDSSFEAKSRDALSQIGAAGMRAAALTQQLLAFSRRQVLRPQVIDLNSVVTELESMLRRLISEHIQVAIALRADPGRVNADRGQLEQVIMNLALNARDAMPEGGRLTIDTSTVSFDEASAALYPSTAPGTYVLLAITDTGHGIPPDVQTHIFEPFFTTKSLGEGTGLGLSTVYGIVKQSGGSIFVYSEPERGTTFKVYLPAADAPLTTAADLRSTPLLAGKGETILLVEDDATVRTFIEQVLTDQGYTVIEAVDGVDALDRSSRYTQTIDLLLTDLVMPRLQGDNLAPLIREQRPLIKTLHMSGYTEASHIPRELLEPGTLYLQKPFTGNTLLEMVRAALDAPPRANTR
jgi:PAS domain S-box-containing protein